MYIIQVILVGESIEAIRSEAGVEIVEMDEMHTYIGVKKTIAGSGLLLIDMENAFSRALWAPATPKRGEQLWDAIKSADIKRVMSDYWSPYEKFIPAEYIHNQKLKHIR